MGRHRKPNRIQKHMAVAVPIVTLCACLLASSPPPGHPVADVLMARPPVASHTLVVDQQVLTTQQYIDAFRQTYTQPPHVINHKTFAPARPPIHVIHHYVTFNEKVIKAAESQIGVPYVWGGETPGVAFDCSGLTEYAYGQAGHWIPRVANDQFHFFRMIPKSQARPGDLVFFHDDSDPNSYVYHVGIYVGGNDMMVVAPDAGSDVQIQNFDWAGDTATFGTLDIYK